MTDPIPVIAIHMPPQQGLPPARHIFGDAVVIAAEISISGHEQKEKTCRNCGAVRVTMIGGPAARAWRRTAEGPQIETEIAPPCDHDAGWPR